MSAQPAPVRPPVSPAVAVPNLAAVTQSATSAQSYVVKPGDSLMKIARDMYGDPNKWTVIYNENRDTLERPNQLKIGQTIRIPALPSTLSAL
jgi:nucleoid-associated protein YgaU